MLGSKRKAAFSGSLKRGLASPGEPATPPPQVSVDTISDWLLQRNSDGDTPLHLACAAGGESDTGDADLKLLLLGWIVDHGLLPRIISAEDEDEDKRMRLVLPELGALLVPNGPELQMQDLAAKQEWLLAYANLPHEGLALCVTQVRHELVS